MTMLRDGAIVYCPACGWGHEWDSDREGFKDTHSGEVITRTDKRCVSLYTCQCGATFALLVTEPQGQEMFGPFVEG